jgi:hypothetical protein
MRLDAMTAYMMEHGAVMPGSLSKYKSRRDFRRTPKPSGCSKGGPKPENKSVLSGRTLQQVKDAEQDGS